LHYGQRKGDERTIKILFEGGAVRIEVPKVETRNFIPAKVIKQVDPDYPAELQNAGNDGRVEIEFVVDVNGVPGNPVVITSTHPALEKPAIDALMKWRFKPAENDGRPIPIKMKVPLSFSLRGSRSVESFSVEKRRSKGLPEKLQVDVPPKPRTTVYAVHPYADAVARKRGSAEVKVLVGSEGNVIATQVVKASSPEFGLSLAAAMEAWTFHPAFKDGKRTMALTKREFKFNITSRIGIVSKLQMIMKAVFRFWKSQCPMPFDTLFFPMIIPFHFRARLYKVLHFHLLKLPHTENKLPGNNFI
jgi:TonB family protein